MKNKEVFMKGKLLYKEDVEIKGYDGTFIKECRLLLKEGLFCINYPVKKISDDIIETSALYGRELKETEKKWWIQVKLFESLSFEYKTVIFYKLEEDWDSSDGSGSGFVFNWGVFRKVTTEGERDIFFERGYRNSKPILDSYHNFKRDKWKEIEWTEQRENFFIGLSDAIKELHRRLTEFVTRPDFNELFKISKLESHSH